MTSLALCVVAKNRQELNDWLIVHADNLWQADELFLVDNERGRFGGYGHVAERALAASRSFVFGLSHADTAYRGTALLTFRDTAAAGNVAGMVGRPLNGQYVWCGSGGIHGPSCLDGCSIFFRRDSGLAFDTVNFDGFHCVGEDIALSARSKGIPLVIPHADADHASTSNFVPGQPPGNKAWLTDYEKYCDRLKKKYPNLQYLVS